MCSAEHDQTINRTRVCRFADQCQKYKATYAICRNGGGIGCDHWRERTNKEIEAML